MTLTAKSSVPDLLSTEQCPVYLLGSPLLSARLLTLHAFNKLLEVKLLCYNGIADLDFEFDDSIIQAQSGAHFISKGEENVQESQCPTDHGFAGCSDPCCLPASTCGHRGSRSCHTGTRGDGCTRGY